MLNTIDKYSEKIYDKIMDNVLYRSICLFLVLGIFSVPLSKEIIDDEALEEKYRQSVLRVLEYDKKLLEDRKKKGGHEIRHEITTEEIYDKLLNDKELQEKLRKIAEESVKNSRKIEPPTTYGDRGGSASREKYRKSLEERIKENNEHINGK